MLERGREGVVSEVYDRGGNTSRSPTLQTKMPTINAICQYHRHNLHRRTIIPHCHEFPVCRRRRLGCLSVGRPSVRRRSEEERSLDSLPPWRSHVSAYRLARQEESLSASLLSKMKDGSQRWCTNSIPLNNVIFTKSYTSQTYSCSKEKRHEATTLT